MAKAKPAVQYSCTECGYSAGRWFGKCPGCSAFGTLVEEVVGQVAHSQAPPQPLLRLVDVEVSEAARIPTGVPELDRVLGGGLVPASLVLVGGEPGDDVDITFIPGEVTPEKVTVPADEPDASADGEEPAGEEA